MAAGSTYTPIAAVTVGTAASSVLVMSSIPSTYTDLVLIVQGATTSGVQELKLTLNSDTASNYSNTSLSGNGSAASSARRTSQTGWIVDSLGGLTTDLAQYNAIINIMNYSNTTTNKTAIARANSTSYATEAMTFLWRSTAAINRIDAVCLTGNWAVGSTFTLYGIQAA